MSPNRMLIQQAVDSFNLKLLLERSIVYLHNSEEIGGYYDITIPPDKNVKNSIINVTDDFREEIEIHMENRLKKEGFKEVRWNNTGNSFRVAMNKTIS